MKERTQHEDRTYNTLAGVSRRAASSRALRCACSQDTFCTTRRNHAARSGLQAKVRTESESAWPEAKGQALDFGPRGSLALEGFRCFSDLAGEFGISQSLSHDLANEVTESVRIIHGQTVIIYSGK